MNSVDIQRKVQLVCKQSRSRPPIRQRKVPACQHTFWKDLQMFTISWFRRITFQKSILHNDRSVLIYNNCWWTPPTQLFSKQNNYTVGLTFSNCILHFIVLFFFKIYRQLTVIELYIHFGKLTVFIPHPHI